MFCTNCGAPIQDRQGPGREAAQRPQKAKPAWQIPDTEVPFKTEPAGCKSFEGEITGLGVRAVAALLDMIVTIAFYVCAGSWIAAKYGGITSGGFQMQGQPALMAILFTMFFFFLYHWLLEGFFGATPGKKIMGIAVRQVNGEPCGFSKSLIRNLLRFIDAIFLYLVGFIVAVSSKTKQRLGDRVAQTVVVTSTTGPASKIIFGVALFCAVMLFVVLTMFARGTGPGKDGGPFGDDPKTTRTLPSGDLKITSFELLETENGPVRPSTVYRPGEQLYSRYLIGGYGKDPQGLVNLKIELVVLDSTKTVMYTWQGSMNRKLAENQSATGSFSIKFPYFAPPGTYHIHIRATDQTKGTANDRAIKFKVDAPKTKVSTKPELYDFTFAAEEGGQPVSPPVFQKGQTVHVTAKLAGMQFDNDRINVRVAFQLVGPKGEVLLDKPDFLTVSSVFRYHPPVFFLPISARVTPPPGYAGVFTGKFTVNDLNRSSSESYSVKFEVK